nr:zinc finger C2HC domain-containing protein 1B [Zootoca vivipara]
MSVIPGNKAATVDASSQNLLSCEICGRHFIQDALARHEPICRKVFNKKRKPFNSLKQRLQGTDIPTVKRKPPPKSQPEKKSNWRQQHENFINTIRSAKLATIAMKEGRPLPPPPPPTINPDYIQCPYCMRRFNEAAAERHINFCKEQAARRAFAPGQKGSKAPPGKQATPKKEPTLTSAVGTLLQNKTQEGTDPSQVVIGHAGETSAATPQKKAPAIPPGKEPG